MPMIQKMRKLVILLGVIVVLISCSTSHKPKTAKLENEIIDINITEALKDVREFNLSEIVRDVEFITLESTVESYFRYTERIQITENFILVVGVVGLSEKRIILFNKSGKFLRQIGQRGGGPSEYNNLYNASIDPKERFIVASDAEKLLKFDVDGTFIKQQKRLSGHRYGRKSQLLFLDNDHFALAFRRPNAPTDDFYQIGVFDSDLNFVEKMLHVPNNDSLCLREIEMNIGLSSGSGEKYFFEGFINNLYSIELGQKPTLKYHFTIDEDAYTLEDMKRPYGIGDGTREYHSVRFVTDLPNHLIITTEHLSKHKASVYQVIYDKTKKVAFSTSNNYGCVDSESKYNELPYFINNDLFGLSPVFVGFFPEETFSISLISIDAPYSDTNLKCLRELNVLMPEKRDELADIIEGYTGEELPLLVLLYYK